MPRAGVPRTLMSLLPVLIFYYLTFFFNKIYIWPSRDLNSSLDPGVGAMSSGVEVTRLGATDLGAEVTSHAQKKILRGRYLDAIIHGADLG